MYVKLKNGIPEAYTVGQLRRDNPNVSFSSEIPPVVLAEYGVFPVAMKEAPVVPKNSRAIKDLLPTQNDQGAWVWGWTVETVPADEQAASTRAKRNALLAASDWTQVADAPVEQAAWATYRQGLRDITAQPGFPADIDWPTRPE